MRVLAAELGRIHIVKGLDRGARRRHRPWFMRRLTPLFIFFLAQGCSESPTPAVPKEEEAALPKEETALDCAAVRAKMIAEAENRIREMRNPARIAPVQDLTQSNLDRKGLEEEAAEQDLADLQGNERPKPASKTREQLVEERCRKLIEAEMDVIRATRREAEAARP